jgi:hypothetical protein
MGKNADEDKMAMLMRSKAMLSFAPKYKPQKTKHTLLM